MKYFAPIVDYISRSTFVEREHLVPLHATHVYDSMRGFRITSAADDVVFSGVIKGSTWSLRAAYLNIISDATRADMKIGIRIWAGADNGVEDRIDTSISAFSLGNVTDNYIYFSVITDRFINVLPLEAFVIHFYWSGTADTTNIWVRGLILEYVLI